MIYEFALDPAVIAEWGEPKSYRYFIDKFGIGTPRMISAFPKKKIWFQKALDCASSKSDLDKKRVELLLLKFKEKMVHRENPQYQDSINWLDNAEKEHKNCHFHSIVSTINPHACPFIILDNVDPHNALWDLKSQVLVKRTVVEISQAVDSMLSICRQVVFIDPYFNPKTHKDLFKKYFISLLKNRPQISLISIEIHCHAEKKGTLAFFESECRKYLLPIMPKGVRIIIKRWHQKVGGEQIHNRYILTDIGGIKFGNSPQEGEGSDEIHILDQNSYSIRWDQYLGNSPAFDLLEKPILIQKI